MPRPLHITSATLSSALKAETHLNVGDGAAPNNLLAGLFPSPRSSLSITSISLWVGVRLLTVSSPAADETRLILELLARADGRDGRLSGMDTGDGREVADPTKRDMGMSESGTRPARGREEDAVRLEEAIASRWEVDAAMGVVELV